MKVVRFTIFNNFPEPIPHILRYNHISKNFHTFIAVRKITSISFLLIFLFGTLGFSVSTHYCGGKNIGTELATPFSQKICGCKGDMQGCCKDDVSTYKVEDDYTASAFSVDFLTQFVALPYFNISFNDLYHYRKIKAEGPPNINGPPPKTVSAYLAFIQTYLI